MKVHLANAVMDRIPEKQLLHSMWEDSDLEGNEAATEQYDWLEKHAPGSFLLIDTGDYLRPCVEGRMEDWHLDCEVYDARYSLYLVPMHVWNECKDAALLADQEWREQKNRCQRSHAEK